MARNPDALEERQGEQARRRRQEYGGPAQEFQAGPSRAEHAMPRSRASQPLWPWVAIIVIVAIAAVIYALVT